MLGKPCWLLVFCPQGLHGQELFDCYSSYCPHSITLPLPLHVLVGMASFLSGFPSFKEHWFRADFALLSSVLCHTLSLPSSPKVAPIQHEILAA